MPAPYEHLFDGMLSHTLTFLGFALMTGHASWRLFVSRQAPVEARETPSFLAGAAMAIAGALINLRQATLSMTGQLTPASVASVLTETLFGQSWKLHAAGLLLTLSLGAWLWRRQKTPQGAVLWLPAAAALLGQSLVGHASAEGWSWPLYAYAAHVTGGVAWLGGLFAWLGRLSQGYPVAMVKVFQPFSRFARACMLLLLPAGLMLSSYFIPRPAAFGSPYGALLGLKLLLVAGVLLTALGHHLWRLPRIRSASHSPEGWKRLEGSLMLEVGLGILVVLVAAALSQVPPPEG